MLEELRTNPTNRLLFDLGPIDDASMREVLKRDDAFALFFMQHRDKLYDFIVREYGLSLDIVRALAEQDYSAWRSAVLRGSAPRFEPLRVKIVSRLIVFEKNRDNLRKLHGLLSLDKGGYLDVGCGHGFTLLAARQIGHGFAHGIEVDPAFFKLGKIFFPEGIDAEMGYAAEDYLSLALPRKYSLITFFDVLEHVADYDQAITKALDHLEDDGAIYFYQGNMQSVQMVRVEPHYRLPLIGLLPRELTINILLRLGRIRSAENYVVAKWPPLDIFRRKDCRSVLLRGPVNFRNGQTYMTAKQAANGLDALKQEYQNALYPVLDDAERRVADATYVEYHARYQEALADPEKHELQFLMASWNVVMGRKSPKLRGDTRVLELAP